MFCELLRAHYCRSPLSVCQHGENVGSSNSPRLTCLHGECILSHRPEATRIRLTIHVLNSRVGVTQTSSCVFPCGIGFIDKFTYYTVTLLKIEHDRCTTIGLGPLNQFLDVNLFISKWNIYDVAELRRLRL